jgi:hypothetical protein
MYQDRRRAERVRVNLSARWEAASIRERGTISDISANGCFLLSGGETSPGEAVRVALELPEGRTIELNSEVVYRTEEIGFAVRFKDDVGRERLIKFVNLLLTERRANAPAEG